MPLQRSRLARVNQRLALQLQRAPVSVVRVERVGLRLDAALSNRLTAQKVRIERAAQALKLLNPQQVLDRGYAVIFDSTGRAVSSAKTVAVDANVRIQLRDGELGARITDTKTD